MAGRYSKEEGIFIRTVAPVCDSFEELSAAVLEHLGIARTPTALYQFCRLEGILIRGEESIHPRKHYLRLNRVELDRRIEYLSGICEQTSDWGEVVLAYNAKYGTEKGVDYVRRMCRRAGLELKAPKTPPRHGSRCCRQLCESCVNAVPNREGTRGCNWSRKFLPVEGWKTRKGGPDFYIVGCPEYREEII